MEKSKKRHIRDLQEWGSRVSLWRHPHGNFNIFKSFLKTPYENYYVQEALHAEVLSTSLGQEDMLGRELK